MGKGARTRRQRVSAVRCQAQVPAAVAARPFFHGGVPGSNVNGVLLPAARLGLRFRYLTPGAEYDPNWVYLTSDEGVAHAYASRYVTGGGERRPGDVYEVQPIGGVQVDPDYHPFPEAFVRCPQARIVRVVARNVVLSEAEQAHRERRYNVWGNPDLPVWDDDGLIIPSKQMLDNGVTREWTTLLRPWLGLKDVDAHGRLLIAGRSANVWATMLEVMPSLDRDHRVERHRRWPWRPPLYRCVVCSDSTDDLQLAAQHQIGADAVTLIARIHRIPLAVVIQGLVDAARARAGTRWAWLSSARAAA